MLGKKREIIDIFNRRYSWTSRYWKNYYEKMAYSKTVNA